MHFIVVISCSACFGLSRSVLALRIPASLGNVLDLHLSDVSLRLHVGLCIFGRTITALKLCCILRTKSWLGSLLKQFPLIVRPRRSLQNFTVKLAFVFIISILRTNTLKLCYYSSRQIFDVFIYKSVIWMDCLFFMLFTGLSVFTVSVFILMSVLSPIMPRRDDHPGSPSHSL